MLKQATAAFAALAILSLSTTADASRTRYNFTGSTFSGGTGNATYRGKSVVSFNRSLKPGTVLIRTNERRLYYVLPGGRAIKYGVGVGRQGFTWRGHKRISRKRLWPGWTPPPEMIIRERKKGRELPAHMPGGPSNPLGARALYLGSSLYRIHGTNASHTIGYAVSSGCIRMLNAEVIDLYNRVRVGTQVIVE